MNKEELNSILDKHVTWLEGESGGERADFSGCDLSGHDFTGCDLRYANLSGCDLRGCDLRGCDLRDADIRNADLRNADLRNAWLRYANLGGCDLSDVTGLPSDPALLRRVCQEATKTGQLNMVRWHTCETTHCIAGWAIHLSGHAGQVMKCLLGPETAGALLIPDASHMFHAPDESVRVWCEKWLEEHPEELTSDGAG